MYYQSFAGCHQSRVFSCLAALAIIALCLGATLAVLVWYAKIQPPVDTQQVYSEIVYSPFSIINHWLFGGVKVQINGTDWQYPHQLTLCQMECPLKIRTKSLTFSGVCRMSRTINCFALFTDDVSSPADAQYVSEYMLKNSSVTFRINRSTKIRELCITADNKDTCQKIVRENLSQTELRQLCLAVISFDISNNYTQTFMAPNDGYYCAVWLLNGMDQLINYTTISSIKTYNLTDFDLCETLPQDTIVTQTLSGPPTQNLCAVLKVDSRSGVFGTNITVVTSAVKVLSDATSVALIVVDIFLIIVLLLVMAIILLVFFVCCKRRPQSAAWIRFSFSSDVQ